MAAPRFISLMNFCKLTVCYLSSLQTCKTSIVKHSVPKTLVKQKLRLHSLLHSRNNENVLHKKVNISHRKKNLLFPPCNMAAVQNLYFPQNMLMLTESRGKFSNLHSILRLRALRY